MAKGVFSGVIWGGVVAVVGAGGLSLAYPDFRPSALPSVIGEPEVATDQPAAMEDTAMAASGDIASADEVDPETIARPETAPEAVEPDVPESGMPETDMSEADMSGTAMADAEGLEAETAEQVAEDGEAMDTEMADVVEPEIDMPETAVADESPNSDVASDVSPDVASAVDPAVESAVDSAVEPGSSVTDDIIAALPTPEGTVGNLAPAVTTGRLPSLANEDVAEADAPSALAPPPIERFAAPFSADEGKPLMAIVLIDDGEGALGLEALESFPYPLTFAVDASRANANERMQTYRDKGFEVLALVDLPRGATPADVEVAMTGYFTAVPEAVGILEGVTTGVQTSRETAYQLTEIIVESGHGMLLQASGLNTARKLAERAGVPAGTVFRDFDGNGQSASVMRRFLDQAAFRAGQEGGVVMMGRLQAETISALLIWGLADRASRVALVPVSAVLTQSGAAAN